MLNREYLNLFRVRKDQNIIFSNRKSVAQDFSKEFQTPVGVLFGVFAVDIIMESFQVFGFSPTDAVIGLLVIKPHPLPLSSFAVQTGLHIPLFQEWGEAIEFFRQVYTTTGWGMICCFYDPVSTQVSLSRFGGIPLAYLLPY